MRIAQLTYSYKPIIGGADVYADMLSRLLESHGHSLRVYQRATTAVDTAVRFLPNPLRVLGRGEFWTQALFLPLLRREIRQEEILIAHYPVYLLAAALCKGRVPALLGFSHGVTWDDRPRSLQGRIKRALAHRAFKIADAFVANDTFFLREMGLEAPPRQDLFCEIAPRRWCIPNCVPPDFRPAPPREDLLPLHAILLPRNIYRNRGILLAVEAFAIFLRYHPATHLLIAGAESQPAYAAEVRRRVEMLGISAKVIFQGHVPHEQMPAYYGAAEMCLIPSLCGEGTSISALEAASCGVAVISSNKAGLKDLPVVLAHVSPEELADTMLQVYPDRRRIGAEQREQVERNYSYERWSQAWMQVISQVAERR